MASRVRTFFRCASLIAVLVATAIPARATSMPMAGDHGRYLGTPDLALTSALIAAGGGPRAFDARRLSTMLCAQHAPDELHHLEARFGAARVARYFATFDAFVDGSLAIVRSQRVALPRPNPALAHDPYVLAASLRAAGVMSDGRFDIGYMIEHLLSRPVHQRVMTVANASPAIGPAANADFHVILTAEMDDLKSLYDLQR